MKSAPVLHRPEPVVHRGWFLAYLDHVEVVYMDGRVDDESYARYVGFVEEDIRERQRRNERTPVLYHIPQPSALTAKRRALLGAVLKQEQTSFATHTCAYAMVTTSSMVRYGLRVLFWLAPPPYPNAVLSSVHEGFEFLARYDRSIHPQAMTERYESLLRELMPRMGSS